MYLFGQAVKPESSIRNFLLNVIPGITGPKTNAMKKIFIALSAALASMGAYAQDAQQAAAEAAKAIEAAPATEVKVEKPKYWSESLKTQINVGQTQLTNWAAGGDNTVSLAAFIDGNANWQKGDMFWNNRLQLDYGFLYASSKPILQKNTDRIYLESKWGYKAPSTRYLYFSANYDFKSQFTTGYDYNTPGSVTDENGNDLEGSALRDVWREARVLKSGFLAPAYTNLALGIDFVPTKWFSLNFAPLTGDLVIVNNETLRGSYSMPLKKEFENVAADALPTDGSQFQSVRFGFGAQLKMDAKVNVNDNFSYSTQVVLFTNYLDIHRCPRINWDNRIDWKLAKYFSFTITTNLIYDDSIMIADKNGENPKARVQFKESMAFGFTYTIANKK